MAVLGCNRPKTQIPLHHSLILCRDHITTCELTLTFTVISQGFCKINSQSFMVLTSLEHTKVSLVCLLRIPYPSPLSPITPFLHLCLGLDNSLWKTTPVFRVGSSYQDYFIFLQLRVHWLFTIQTDIYIFSLPWLLAFKNNSLLPSLECRLWERRIHHYHPHLPLSHGTKLGTLHSSDEYMF